MTDQGQTTISLRVDSRDLAILDRLVELQRERYSEVAPLFPPAARFAREVNRSSALRDLLLAWDHGATIFDRKRPPTPDLGQRIADLLAERS